MKIETLKENNMNVYVSFMNASIFEYKKLYQQTYDSLPEIRKNKVDQYKNEKDKILSVMSWYLLKEGLLELGTTISKYELCVKEDGKPYLKNCPYEFSISHSGEYACVAISLSPVGVDIQEQRPFDEKLVDFISNDAEKKIYKLALDKTDAFYKTWCIKESYIKLTGEGLKKPLKEVEVNSKNYVHKYYNGIKGYSLAVSSFTNKNFIFKEQF